MDISDFAQRCDLYEPWRYRNCPNSSIKPNNRNYWCSFKRALVITVFIISLLLFSLLFSIIWKQGGFYSKNFLLIVPFLNEWDYRLKMINFQKLWSVLLTLTNPSLIYNSVLYCIPVHYSCFRFTKILIFSNCSI